jgi:hypothetical protein
MPKAQSSKSQVIRDLFTENPVMSAADVMKVMTAKKMNVSKNLIYQIKTKMKAKKPRTVRGNVNGAGHTSSLDPVTLIMRAKELADQAGGIQKLKQLVEVLAE